MFRSFTTPRSAADRMGRAAGTGTGGRAPRRLVQGLVATAAALAATGTCLATTATATTAGQQAAPAAHSKTAAKDTTREASLTGAAKMYREDGQRVHFSFDAHGFGPEEAGGTSRGTFRFSHFTADGKEGAHFEGRIDCLITGGPVATATGVITRSDHPDGRVVGKRVGFTVYDNGRHDRLGYSWAGSSIPEMTVPKCLSAAPYETVETGDFTVRHVMPPVPTGR
ncbi:hypothetical protein ACH4OW_12055 [Streptomyces sp. NPDC017056]|uniref:hypothetical protein n=1 Tax=Streptomyces sp. NPDC017056 TaxID=3364973 RepID=UPI003799DA9E